MTPKLIGQYTRELVYRDRPQKPAIITQCGRKFIYRHQLPVEAATVFPAWTDALKKIAAFEAVLAETADRMKDAVYSKIRSEFTAEVISTEEAYAVS